MDKNDLIQLLATHKKMPPAAAADEIDRVVNKILLTLRRGVAVSLPGLGVLRPTHGSGIQFYPADPKELK